MPGNGHIGFIAFLTVFAILRLQPEVSNNFSRLLFRNFQAFHSAVIIDISILEHKACIRIGCKGQLFLTAVNQTCV